MGRLSLANYLNRSFKFYKQQVRLYTRDIYTCEIAYTMTIFSKTTSRCGCYLKTAPEVTILNIKQLLDEVEHDIMNYQNRGLCYLFYYIFFKQ